MNVVHKEGQPACHVLATLAYTKLTSLLRDQFYA